ncbi:MAG: hypothetical protein ACRDQ4_08065 [Pseudonocardiaceae bacterium]
MVGNPDRERLTDDDLHTIRSVVGDLADQLGYNYGAVSGQAKPRWLGLSWNPGAGTVLFTRAEMHAWIRGVKTGEFDDRA